MNLSTADSNRAPRRAFTGACLLLLTAAAGSALPAAAQPAHPAKLEFEVASIRKGEERSRGTVFLMGTAQPKSSLFSANAYIESYIRFAFGITDTGLSSETGKTLPTWAHKGQWDINARSERTPTRDELRRMVRSLLEERFKLRTHYETRRLAVTELVLAKPGQPGPDLKPHPQGAPCTEAGGAVRFDKSGNSTYKADCTTLDDFAGIMGGLASGRYNIVVNRTGLTGPHDLRLRYIVEGTAATGQPFEEALLKQLGLKLRPGTASLQVLVVDHIEPPAAN